VDRSSPDQTVSPAKAPIAAGAKDGTPDRAGLMRKIALATALTLLSGFTDAIGYSALGHLYISFMSGNSTHFGMSLAVGDGAGVQLAGAIILSFVVGSTLGTVIGDRTGPSPAIWILGTELLIVVWAVAASRHGDARIALVPVAAAMGMQNVLHQVISGADVGKGFVTGSLFGLGQSLGRFLQGRGQGGAAFQNGWSWLSFITGVSLGALCYNGLGLTAALVAVAIALVCLLIVIRLLHPPAASAGGR